MTRRQLRGAGLSDEAIDHRIKKRRLHPLFAGVYAVGRREISQEGVWMAAVLACGDGAVLSHASAAQLWGFRPIRSGPVDISVPETRHPRRPGIRVHRRKKIGRARRRRNIPLTAPQRTLIDLAAQLSRSELERAINEADKLDLAHPEALRHAAAEQGGVGGSRIRTLLDKSTFLLTDSELERLFIPIAERAGMPEPEAQVVLHGHRVDFLFRELGVVVETDGLRYHRTPSQQRRDRVRDQELTAAGLRVLRFTHGQVKFEPDHVADILRRLSSEP